MLLNVPYLVWAGVKGSERKRKNHFVFLALPGRVHCPFYSAPHTCVAETQLSFVPGVSEQVNLVMARTDIITVLSYILERPKYQRNNIILL